MIWIAVLPTFPAEVMWAYIELTFYPLFQIIRVIGNGISGGCGHGD